MKRNHTRKSDCGTLIGVVFGLVWITGCAPENKGPNAETDGLSASGPVVYTTVYPAHYFATTLGENLIEVRYGPGSERGAEGWRPDGDQLDAMARANAILVNGAGFEEWLEKVSLPQGLVQSLSDEWRSDWIELEDAVIHSHGDEGEHSHAGLASMVWLDFTLASRQVVAIEDLFVALRPDAEALIRERSQALREELRSLDEAFEAAFAMWKETPGLASHPVYPYLAKRFGLSMQSMHWEPGVEPGSDEWSSLDAMLVDHPANWMLWEGEPAPEARRQLEERGIRVIVLPTGVDQPDTGDFMDIMRSGLTAIARPRLQWRSCPTSSNSSLGLFGRRSSLRVEVQPRQRYDMQTVRPRSGSRRGTGRV